MVPKLGMIPFFIPHVGCPHQCSFCNQHRIAGQEDQGLGEETIYNIIVEYVASSKVKKHWEVAFYGGSFTAIPIAQQERMLRTALRAKEEGLIQSIRCSTRPDCVGHQELQRLVKYGVNTVELGVQSMDDGILDAANRGHSAQDVVDGVQRLREYGLTVGIQLLPGLLGDTWHTLIHTAVSVSTLAPDFVRIYPVLVIDDTPLADAYHQGAYEPLSMNRALAYCAFLKTWMEQHHITVIRTGLQSTTELDAGQSIVAGPYAPAFGELVINEQYKWKVKAIVQEHIAYFGLPEQVMLAYPRTLTSQVRGVQSRNVQYFHQQYPMVLWQYREHESSYCLCIIDNVPYMI